jgi:plastocyanin
MTVISNGGMIAQAANMTELKNANVSNVPEAVEVEDMAYQTNPVKIKAGESIIWTNNDLTAHTVTEGNPSTAIPTEGFDSGLISPDQSYKHVFDKAGTIEYHCLLHPTMIGKVIVS